MVRTPEFSRYEVLESAIASSEHRPRAEELRQWRSTVPTMAEKWLQAQAAASNALRDLTDSERRTVMLQLALFTGIGLLVVLASVLLSVRYARSMAGELRDLQGAAQHLAHERLPDVVARLRAGKDVDAGEELSPFASGRTREVAMVAEAFTRVQQTVIESAVGEAKVREGISRVFTNLAWRSQSLLHRQLRMLDALERKASSPEELEDIFRLDHLTTRMRRHAEGLVILSGAKSVRGWDKPVPVDDVLRAAVSEVEDYTRVNVTAEVSVELSGSVVADVTHLLAELIENATTFSPPSTEVDLRAEIVGTGLSAEVVDRGVGMDAADLAQANRQPAEAPEFDLADSEKLGLFVVARLASRHAIRVTLAPSVYGGTTAVVLIPASFLASHKEQTLSSSAPVPAVRPDDAPRARTAPVPQRPLATGAGGPGVSGAQPSEPRPTRDGEDRILPRRRRRQHLAPQLQRPKTPSAFAAETTSQTGVEDSFDEHRPEANRRLLSSLQAGWKAARSGTDSEASAPHPPATDENR